MSTGSNGSDKGYFFHGPKVIDRTMPLANGITLKAFHIHGVVVSDSPDSPLYETTLYAQGTTILDADGQVKGDVQLIEFTDPDGDANWIYGLNWTSGASGEYVFGAGIGKWQGITGSLCTLGASHERADDHVMPRYEVEWAIAADAAPNEASALDESLPNYDTGYSFHGAHVPTARKELRNGPILVASTQCGVLISENANSPRHHATCHDRGTTIQSAEGKALGDVMLLEDTDADGDVTWLYHEWWYGRGPGSYRFIGGTGKWEGIQGTGRTLAMIARRADDHYMPSWELRWRIDN